MTGTCGRDNPARARTLRDLAERIEAVQRREAAHAGPAVVTGLSGKALPGAGAVLLDALPCGVLHEWLYGEESKAAVPGAAKAAVPGAAPILVFAHFAWRALLMRPGALVVWIGRRVWPGVHVLVGRSAAEAGEPERSLLVDPASDDERLWAIDLCLRSPAAAVVIADASGMQLAHSRRLQLAAEAGSALALLARPNHERTTLSAAPRRYRIACVRSPTMQPRWRIELVRCKGVQRGKSMDADASLIVEHCRATGGLCIPADLADRSAEAPAEAWAQLPGPGARKTG